MEVVKSEWLSWHFERPGGERPVIRKSALLSDNKTTCWRGEREREREDWAAYERGVGEKEEAEVKEDERARVTLCLKQSQGSESRSHTPGLRPNTGSQYCSCQSLSGNCHLV